MAGASSSWTASASTWQEGSVLRLGPAAARAWRNNSDAPLYFLCLQYRADSVIQGGTARRPEGRGQARLAELTADIA